MSKTKAAFVFSVEKLFAENEQIYFWTFTFKSVPASDHWAMVQWDDFRKRLISNFKSMRGLRVVELHRSHGLHFHILVNIRIPIDRVMRIARGTGRPESSRNWYLDFGRMSVTRCDESTGLYLAKYMSKDYKAAYPTNLRRWGSIGGFKPVHVRDITYESDTTRNRSEIFGTQQCNYATLMMIQHYTNLWGRVQDWPMDCMGLVLNQEKHRRMTSDKLSDKTIYEIQEGFKKKTAEVQRVALQTWSSTDVKNRALGGCEDLDADREQDKNWDGEKGDEPDNKYRVGWNEPF